MRPLLAAVLTTVVPMIVGRRFVAGPLLIQWCLGAVVGVVLLAMGGLFGGLAGAPVGGAVLMLFGAWFLAPQVRWDAGGGATRPPAYRAVLLMLLGAGAVLLAMSFFRPVPSWDAWFQWSLKSKGLALARSFESPVFVSPAYEWSSQEYPTLLPSWQALAYIVCGDLSISWPLQFQQAWLWATGSVALVALTGGYVEGAFLLPLAWVITPQVLWQSMQGYADVPMALMLVLGTAVLWRDRFDPAAHVVGGLLLAGAALTKSEGAPLAAIVLLCLIATRERRVVLALAPAIVVVARLPWFLFTQLHGVSSQMINATTVKALVSGDAVRHLPEIVFTLAFAMFSPVQWGLLVPGCLAAALLARRIDRRLAAATVLQLALFAAVYEATWSFQGTPLDVFMRSNVSRVLIAPLGLLALAVALGHANRPRTRVA